MCAASHCLHNGASAIIANLWVCMCLPCQTFLQGGFKAVKKMGVLLVSLKVAPLHGLKCKSYWFAVHHVDSRSLSSGPVQQSWDVSGGGWLCPVRKAASLLPPVHPQEHVGFNELPIATQTQLPQLPFQRVQSKTLPAPLLL